MFNNQLNFSYAHSVLQSLFFLDSSQDFYNFMINNNIRFNMLFPMANELLNIFDSIRSGNIANSQNILFYYGNYYMQNKMNIHSKNVLEPDPFHFLYFLLQFLHMETNISSTFDSSLFNQNLDVMRNENLIYMLFLQFIISQNSIISNAFFNTVRYTYKCSMCGMYYFYGLQNIFRMNIDLVRYYRDMTYPMKKGTNLELSELFLCYCGGNSVKCRHCGNSKNARYTKICFPSKIIIISLERKNHILRNDVNYMFDFDFGNYISKTKTQGMNLNTNYELKAVISYINIGIGGKYFADCKIKAKNMMQPMWFRYIDSQCFPINKNDIFNYEPQLLIYEVKNNFNNGTRLGINLNINNFNNMNPYLMNNNMNMNMINNMGMNNGMEMNNNMNLDTMLGNSNNLIYLNNNSSEMMKNMMNTMNQSSSPVDSTLFNKITLGINDNINNKNFINNMINIQNPLANNQFMMQISNFNKTSDSNNQINLNNFSANKEININEAQIQNKNMIKYFDDGYMSASQLIN